MNRIDNIGGAQRKISQRVKPLAARVATCVLLFSPCVLVHAGLLKGDVDFSNYDAPLFQQILKRMKVKVAARLGLSPSSEERYPGNKILLLESMDIKKDLYGFVYVPERNRRGLYDPFPNAAAYHR